MNDEEFERQQQRIRDLCDKWIQPLGLGWWDIEIGYARSDFEVDGKPAPNALASCSADWRYGHAYIEFNMPLVAGQSDERLERSFVHELMHIFLKETRETGDDWLDHEERVASTLTKAFLWFRDHVTEEKVAVEQIGVGGAAPELRQQVKGAKPRMATIKKTGSFKGKSNKLGYGGRAAQMKAQGVPGGVIGAIARSEGAAPGGPNYHGSKKKGK